MNRACSSASGEGSISATMWPGDGLHREIAILQPRDMPDLIPARIGSVVCGLFHGLSYSCLPHSMWMRLNSHGDRANLRLAVTRRAATEWRSPEGLISRRFAESTITSSASVAVVRPRVWVHPSATRWILRQQYPRRRGGRGVPLPRGRSMHRAPSGRPPPWRWRGGGWRGRPGRVRPSL